MDDPAYTKKRIFEQIRRNSERQAELELERQKAEIRAQSHALVWRGDTEELRATIMKWFELGWIEAESRDEALRKASIHFVKSDGTAAISPLWDDESRHPIEQRFQNTPLPGATISGADINDWVAWNGETYVLRQTREMVLAESGLKLIGSVRELSQSRRFGPGMITVIPVKTEESQAKTIESEPSPLERLRPFDDAYEVIEFDGQPFDLTKAQATIIRVLHAPQRAKRSSVGLAEIQKALHVNSGKMSQWFRGRNKSLYGKLIVQTASRNHYRIDI